MEEMIIHATLFQTRDANTAATISLCAASSQLSPTAVSHSTHLVPVWHDITTGRRIPRGRSSGLTDRHAMVQESTSAEA